ncbi:hypothetical protein [Litorimonas sp.]|uniref:hypothetical protein n=1 Tax=Litorimonas sp. TaxID=1892381 RepID=UPI003A884A96
MSAREGFPIRSKLEILIAKTWWVVRYILNLFVAVFTCFLLTLSISRLLNIDLVNWEGFLGWVLENFGENIADFVAWLIEVIKTGYLVVLNLITIYLIVGALMRLSVRNIGLHLEGVKIWRPTFKEKDFITPEQLRDDKRQELKEAKRHYFLWPERLRIDWKERHYSLSPLRMLCFSLLTLALFVLIFTGITPLR